MESEMTDEQIKELAELRVDIQDLKYQLIQKHDLRELSDEEIVQIYKETEADNGWLREFVKAILKKASEK